MRWPSRLMELLIVALVLACLPACTQLWPWRKSERVDQHYARPPSHVLELRGYAERGPVLVVYNESEEQSISDLRSAHPSRMERPHVISAAKIEPKPPEQADVKPITTVVTAPPRELRPLVEALEAYLANRPDLALEHLSVYDPRDQDILIRLLPIIASADKDGLWGAGVSDEQRLAHVQNLRSLLEDMEKAAPLVIDKMVFCRDVKTFGWWVPVSSSQFRPGDPVKVYVELQNLRDGQTDRNDRRKDHPYETRLACTLEIVGADSPGGGDKRPRTQSVRSAPDISWSNRQDHFTLIKFDMPRDLSPGLYTLRIKITDLDTQREAEKALNFRVVGLNQAK